MVTDLESKRLPGATRLVGVANQTHTFPFTLFVLIYKGLCGAGDEAQIFLTIVFKVPFSENAHVCKRLRPIPQGS